MSSPRCLASAKALRELADLVETGVVTLTDVETTFSPTIMASDRKPLSTQVSLKFRHTGTEAPGVPERQKVFQTTGHLLNCVTLSNVTVA